MTQSTKGQEFTIPLTLRFTSCPRPEGKPCLHCVAFAAIMAVVRSHKVPSGEMLTDIPMMVSEIISIVPPYARKGIRESLIAGIREGSEMLAEKREADDKESTPDPEIKH